MHVYSSEFYYIQVVVVDFFCMLYSGKFHYNTLKSKTSRPSISSDKVNLYVIKASIFSLKLAYTIVQSDYQN